MLDFVPISLFIVLLIAGMVGALSVIPLSANINSILKSSEESSQIRQSRSGGWARYFFGYLIVLAIALLIGFYVAQTFPNLGAPFINAWLKGKPLSINLTGLILPLFTGFLIGALFSPLTKYQPENQRVDFYSIPLWKRLIAGILHGGIAEEILFRWGLLSLLILGITMLTGASLSIGGFWIANAIAALAFGMAHLPGSAAAAPMSRRMVFLVLSSNMLAGLVYGYFFWSGGIEMAIAAHIGTHIALQPLAAALSR